MTDQQVIRSEFDAYARNYEQAVDHPLRRVVDSSGRYFVEFKCAELQALSQKMQRNAQGLVIADIGCGLGDFETYLASRFQCILGVDISFEMLRIAHQKVPLQNGIYICGSASQIPLPDACADVVFASCMFHHIDHSLLVPILKEMRRICRPNGYIMVFEHNPFNPITQFVVRTTPIDKSAHLIRSSQMLRAFHEAGIQDAQRQYILYAPRRIDQFLRTHIDLLRRVPFGGQYFVLGCNTP